MAVWIPSFRFLHSEYKWFIRQVFGYREGPQFPTDGAIGAEGVEHTLETLSILLHLDKQLNEGGFFFINYPHYMECDWHTPEAFFLYCSP